VDYVLPVGLLVIGLGLGLAGAWLLARSRLSLLAGRLERSEQDLARARADLEEKSGLLGQAQVQIARLQADLEHERRAGAEKLALLDEAKTALADAFKALSAEALRFNNEAFLELAKANLEKFQVQARGDLELRQKAVEGLVQPIKVSLEQVSGQINELEKARREAYGSLTEQVRSLAVSQEKLHSETSNLVKALRRPQVRGRWGEIQLKRVVEMAGMMPHCDFTEQQSVQTEDGLLRPDLIVRLPGGKNVVVDAKAPLEAYLNAVEAQDEVERQRFLQQHAQQIRAHVAKLGQKAYWSKLEATPEFVIMFLPGESFFSAALELDPRLIEEGVRQRVILATPTSLIALLRAVAYGWQQERIAESAQQISQIGRELYDRLSVLTSHFERLGNSLDKAVDAYNRSIGSLEGRVLASARRFLDLGIDSDKKLDELPVVDKKARAIEAPELVNPLRSESEDDR